MRRLMTVYGTMIAALSMARLAAAEGTAIVIDSAILRADDLSFAARLETDTEVSGTQNDVLFDPPTLIGVRANGRPHCQLNADFHHRGTSFAFRPAGCTPGESCTRLRALVLSLTTVDPIESGSVLYTCWLDPETPPGRYPLRCDGAGAANPEGVAVPTTCEDGAIEVAASTVLAAGARFTHPGEIALVAVRAYSTEGATSVDTNLAVSMLPLRGLSTPACVAEDGVDAAFAFVPEGCAGADCTGVHAVAQSASGAPFASGAVLFTCGIDVPPTTHEGAYAVSLSGASGRTASGEAAAMSVVDGVVQVFTQGRTPTPVDTPVEATPTPALSRIEVGSATGAPGSRVRIGVTLHTSEGIGGVQNDLHFEPRAAIAVSPGGIPDCTVDPTLDWIDGPEFSFQPPACVPGLNCTGIRALLITAEPLATIASGTVLYTCTVAIDPGASGTAALTCDNSLGSTPQGGARDVSCSGGRIAVVAPSPVPTPTALPASQPTPTLPSGSSVDSAPSGGGSCAVVPAHNGAWWLLAPLLLAWRKRRRN